MIFPLRITGSLWPTYVPVRFVYLTVKQTYTITLYNKNLFEFTFAHLRYSLGGDRPSQTTFHRVSLKKLVNSKNKGGISSMLL